MEIKPNVIAMEILAYLAYETVAQLVDLALLVRQDMVSKAGDPFSHAISATFIQYHNSAEGSSCLKSSPDSPENTPPPTPTAPSSGSQHSGRAASGSLGNGNTGQDTAKTKQRKRKKSTAACGVEAHSDAIQPCHIREAIRRYGHKIGPLSPFTISLSLTECLPKEWDGFPGLLRGPWPCLPPRRGSGSPRSFLPVLPENKIGFYVLLP
eukprot:XP_011244549.1 PREDICTED: transcription initiation protein SPT3 homolog isoform X8 [Mus musculus]